MKRGRSIPAPYIPDPQRLVLHASMWPHAAFVRTHNPARPGSCVDMFYAGHVPNYDGYYRPEAPLRWQRRYTEMLEFELAAPLAGYFSYEFGHQFEEDRWADLPKTRGKLFSFITMVCWYEADHESQTAKICAAPGVDKGTFDIFTEFVRDCMDRKAAPHPASPRRAPLPDSALAALGEFSPAEYTDAVARIIDDIRAGRYYELNFTQRFQVNSPVSPAELFCDLTERLQPRYAFYSHYSDGEAIVSISPELFLRKDGNAVQTCPIKGSYRQPPTAAEREKLAAEHIMVVDLARNDLGRISDQGWVCVEEQAAEKSFGEIRHLESRIAAQTSFSLHQILAATSPAASITGMPKVTTVEHIARYERSPRGLYTGNCGILWPNGDFQLNVAIRSLRATYNYENKTWEYTLGAGGAITADSSPEQEYAECLTKVRPLIRALL